MQQTINLFQKELHILPTKRAIRDIVDKNRQNNILLPKYISVGDFFQRVVYEKNNYHQIDPNLKVIFLREAIENIDIEKLGLNKEFSVFFKQSDYIFKFFNELSYEYIDIDRLFEYDIYEMYHEHMSLLKQIYINYTKLLEEHKLTDSFLLPYNFEVNHSYLLYFDMIVFHLEGYLSSYEFKILQTISQQHTLHIKLFINEFNTKIISTFKEFDLKQNYAYTLDLSNNKIISQEPLDFKTPKLCISKVGLRLEQIGFIKYQITQMYNQGIEPQNIAVVLPNEQFAKFLKLFDNEHYFNFAMGNDILNSKIIQILKLIKKIITDYEPYDKFQADFLQLDQQIYENIFLKNWNTTITKKIFDDIFDYLFTLEENKDILQKLEYLKLSLENSFFTKNTSFVLRTKDFLKVLINELTKITLDDTKGGKITVLGILETRAVQFDGVIVIDFNDEYIPKISVKDKFLSSALKEKLNLPTNKHREDLQRFYYKNLFSRAKKVAISYVDNETLTISRFVTQLFDNYKQYFCNNKYEDILYYQKDFKHFYKDIVLDIDLSKLSWSATSLKIFLQCKRKYYFKYIAKIKEHDISIAPLSFEVGNIIHSCLEQAFNQNNLTNSFVANYFANYSKQNPYIAFELEVWKKRLAKFIAFEKQRIQNNLKKTITEKPFRVVYEDITLTGTIDRIDIYNDNFAEILDYKTSSTLKVDTPKTYKNSTDFQLEFYYLGYQDRTIKNIAYYDLYNTKILQETMLEQKLELLKLHLKALKTTKVDFVQTQDQKICQYCPYATICDKN